MRCRPAALRRARARTRHARSPRSLYHDATARTGEECRPASDSIPVPTPGPGPVRGAPRVRHSHSHARGAASLARRGCPHLQCRSWRAAGNWSGLDICACKPARRGLRTEYYLYSCSSAPAATKCWLLLLHCYRERAGGRDQGLV